ASPDALLLQDLGTEPYARRRSSGELAKMLARSLAHLHCQSRPHFSCYLELRAGAGLPSPEEDVRRYGGPAYQSLFAMGRDFVLSRHELACVRHEAASLAAEFDAVRKRIADPGLFAALIHDDLGNARQTYEVGDALYLLDFETARWGHCLLDLTKPMLGKFERDMSNGNYIWTGSTCGMGLYHAYRSDCSEIYGLNFDDETWGEGMATALMFAGFALTGRLCRLETNRRLVGTVTQNLRRIYACLNDYLTDLGRMPATRKFIVQFLCEV
ncbi:MAG: hypothetical protein AAF441_04185, partial [Pseudomonadota bacterium]